MFGIIGYIFLHVLTNQSKIQVSNINKTFGDKKVLQGIDFEVKKGESFVIVGGSGTGKSVLIKTIIGLIIPDDGSKVVIEGRDITFLPLRQREDIISKFGMLFQGGALFDSLLVWENIVFTRINKKRFNRREGKALAIAKLQLVGLGVEVAEMYPAELSGGMQKRVALARAIADDPEVIFFDEPTAGLDPIMAGVISELIVKCSEELSATTITITHDMNCAQRVADKVAMIYEGKFIWQGNGDDLYHSGNAYVEQFIHGQPNGPIKFT